MGKRIDRRAENVKELVDIKHDCRGCFFLSSVTNECSNIRPGKKIEISNGKCLNKFVNREW